MNQTPGATKKASVLEVYLENQKQGTIHLYVNGGIKVSKVKLDEGFLKRVHGPTQMMNQSTTYTGFNLVRYREALEGSLNTALRKSNPIHPRVKVREKNLNGTCQKLLEKQYRMKHGHQI
jgi:hypothetical protein